MAVRSQRERMGELMDLLVAKRSKVHYAQIRPMPTHGIHTEAQLRRRLRSRAGITMDCSESVTLIAHLAGLRDPNGRDYDGTGYTGTLLNYLEHYTDPSRAKIGALVVFGAGTGEHVCMVRKRGNNPELFSHGREYDPGYYPLSTMLAAFAGQPHTFLSVAKLIHPA